MDVNIHRCLRRGAAYGPVLPEGALEDDGADRGIVFLFMGTDLARQFEFLKSQWVNDGNFTGLGTEKDPVVGANDGTGTFTIPGTPSAGGCSSSPASPSPREESYFFLPGIRAQNWLADLGS